MLGIEQVWSNICAHAGETFHQIRGAQFTYDVDGDYVTLHRTNRKIPRADFEKALALFPLTGTTAIQHLQGPSYVYAIVMDDRITGQRPSQPK
jgi:hypothetical protein